MRHWLLVLVEATLLFTLFLSLTALGQTNLVTNGTFDTDVTGWTKTTSGGILWEGTEGHAAPGAAYVENVRTSTTSYSAGGWQCINLPTPTASYYTVQGWVKVPTQTVSSAAGYIRLQFYSLPDCDTATGSARDTTQVPAGSDWTYLNKTTTYASGAQSVALRLLVWKPGSSGTAYAYFDDIVFYASGPNAVTLGAFTARVDPTLPLLSWGTGGLLVGLVLGRLSRRVRV